MVVYGTRPEGIKLAPVIKAMQADSEFELVVVSTGQHAGMLDQVNSFFGILPDIDLHLFELGQSLNKLAAKIFNRLDAILESERPDALLIQGDTTTVAAAAIAAFYRKVAVVHLEAGLRSGNLFSPFPEEANRILTSQLALLHLAPTHESKTNLLRNGVDPRNIAVTGNTVIDALLHTVNQRVSFTDSRVADAVNSGKRLLVVTSHRRENIGVPMENAADALAILADKYPEDMIIFPMHANPQIGSIFKPRLDSKMNVLLTSAMDYSEFTHLLNAAHIILTDSGGVQEEAPSLGKPVLLLRENTERPEAVTAGTVRLIGTTRDRIVSEVSLLKESDKEYATMANAVNPYGDGNAAKRCVAAIKQLFGMGARLPDFDPISADQFNQD